MVINTIIIAPIPDGFFGQRGGFKTRVETALVRVWFNGPMALDSRTALPEGLGELLALLCGKVVEGVDVS